MSTLNVSEHLKIESIRGSASRGGWEVQFQVMADTDLLDLNQELIVTWDPIFQGANWSTQVAFYGHVVPSQFTFSFDGSLTKCIARTSDAFLERGWVQGVHFVDTDAVARSNYHQFDSITGGVPERLTLGRLVRHFLGFYDQLGAPPGTNPDWIAHTNLVYHATENPAGWIDDSGVETVAFADPGNLDGTARAKRYMVRESNNLWGVIRAIAINDHFVAYFDKENHLHYERIPMFQVGALPTPVMTFTKEFCAGRPQVIFRGKQQIRQVRYHAVTDDADTLHADFPASSTHVYGNVIDQSRFRCSNQDALDHWAEIRYYWENRPYTIKWPAPGLCGLLFELHDRIAITYTGTTANGVDIDWTEEKFWITDINVSPNTFLSGKTVFTLESENAIP